MKQYKIQEFQECLRYDHSAMPQVQIRNVVKGDIQQENLRSHVISIIMEGSIRIAFPDSSKHTLCKGQMIFMPAGSVFAWTTLADSQILICRLLEPSIRLCDNFPIERLYYTDEEHPDKKQIWNEAEKPKERFSVLDVHPRLWQRLECTRNTVADGVRCKKYFETEVDELLLMIRLYYCKEDLYKFLHFIVTGNMVFTEYIRLRWRNYHTVSELAKSMHLTPKYFTRKFKQFFNQLPHQWMASNRAQIIFGELTTTSKPLKQIALENGFNTFQQFAVFTKKMLGKTPTEIRVGSNI
jgi:AraC-like DNA-binding protein